MKSFLVIVLAPGDIFETTTDITSTYPLFGGAVVKVSVVPVIEYVSFSWYTPAINTLVNNVENGVTDKVKATVVPSPTKSSLAI